MKKRVQGVVGNNMNSSLHERYLNPNQAYEDPAELKSSIISAPLAETAQSPSRNSQGVSSGLGRAGNGATTGHK